jgi:hypothetical protein
MSKAKLPSPGQTFEVPKGVPGINTVLRMNKFPAAISLPMNTTTIHSIASSDPLPPEVLKSSTSTRSLVNHDPSNTTPTVGSVCCRVANARDFKNLVVPVYPGAQPTDALVTTSSILHSGLKTTLTEQPVFVWDFRTKTLTFIGSMCPIWLQGICKREIVDNHIVFPRELVQAQPGRACPTYAGGLCSPGAMGVFTGPVARAEAVSNTTSLTREHRRSQSLLPTSSAEPPPCSTSAPTSPSSTEHLVSSRRGIFGPSVTSLLEAATRRISTYAAVMRAMAPTRLLAVPLPASVHAFELLAVHMHNMARLDAWNGVGGVHMDGALATFVLLHGFKSDDDTIERNQVNNLLAWQSLERLTQRAARRISGGRAWLEGWGAQWKSRQKKIWTKTPPTAKQRFAADPDLSRQKTTKSGRNTTKENKHQEVPHVPCVILEWSEHLCETTDTPAGPGPFPLLPPDPEEAIVPVERRTKRKKPDSMSSNPTPKEHRPPQKKTPQIYAFSEDAWWDYTEDSVVRNVMQTIVSDTNIDGTTPNVNAILDPLFVEWKQHHPLLFSTAKKRWLLCIKNFQHLNHVLLTV